MLKWAIIFAVVSLIAGVFGFTGVASGAAGIAKIFFIESPKQVCKSGKLDK